MITIIFFAVTLYATAAESSGLLNHRSPNSGETFEAIHIDGEILNIANSTVTCTFTTEYSNFGMRNFKTCLITQNVENEDYYLKSDINPSVELFIISKNENVKYLPRDIGVKFPNLTQFKAEYAGLTILRDFNLKNMRKARFVALNHNQINTIEPKAFDDLVNVEWMHLHYNELETLDAKLFAKTFELEYLNLNYNKIKTLKPSNFKTPNGRIERIELMGNVCVDRVFGWFYLKDDFEIYLNENNCSE